jgi:hypothetical protein
VCVCVCVCVESAMGRVEDMSEDVFNFASSISSSSRQGLVGEVSEWAPPIERDEISTHTQGGEKSQGPNLERR